jgi:beta-carotene/zeaxanthin 4-ketolase
MLSLTPQHKFIKNNQRISIRYRIQPKRISATATSYKTIHRQQSIVGITIASTLITNWGFAFHHALYNVNVGNIVEVIPAIMWLEFACTGLFITSHDSMHNSIAPTWPKINMAIGTLCSLLYAGFWMPTDLLPFHKTHHEHPGIKDIDPDYHDEGNISLKWYADFMKSYVSIPQFIRLQLMVLLLMYGPFHAPFENLMLIWAPAGLISACGYGISVQRFLIQIPLR